MNAQHAIDLRQERIRKRSAQKKKADSVQSWIGWIRLVSRLQILINVVQQYRQCKRRAEMMHAKAIIITRHMRLYRFRQYRKRVRMAFRVMSLLFLLKVKLWKKCRRRLASDRVRKFLEALEEENVGGSLALIVKGKKWRAYRINVIFVQRCWRRYLRVMIGQCLLIDEQWKLEQERLTNAEVNHIYMKRENEAQRENEQIESLNHTRRLLKLRPLPTRKVESREAIKASLMEGKDILDELNIVPEEIRHSIIKDFLKHVKYLFVDDLEKYNRELSCAIKMRTLFERQSAHLELFNGSSFNRRSTRSMDKDSYVRDEALLTLSRPRLRILPDPKSLQELMKLGDIYVEALRKAWAPTSMDTVHFSFDSKGVAQMQHRIWQDRRSSQ